MTMFLVSYLVIYLVLRACLARLSKERVDLSFIIIINIIKLTPLSVFIKHYRLVRRNSFDLRHLNL